MEFPTFMCRVLLLAVAVTSCCDARLPDWLVHHITVPTTLEPIPGGLLRLTNGIISRDFTLTPGFGTVDFYSHVKNASLLRALGPETVIALDGVVYSVGALRSNLPRAYLNRTDLEHHMSKDPDAFRYVSHRTAQPEAPYPYKPRRGAPKDLAWPPRGLRLDVTFRAPPGAPKYHSMVTVILHYEMYTGVPLLQKWLTVSAEPAARGKIRVAVLSVEHLSVNWPWASQGYGWMDVTTDSPHGNAVTWGMDPQAASMPGSFEAVVNCSYSPVTELLLADTPMTSFKVREQVLDTSDTERVGLSRRRMLRLLAPQTQESPIFFHMVKTDPGSVRSLLDQMSEVGFEMMFYSFGSGFNFESDNATYISETADLVKYALKLGIEVGGYDLISLTRKVEKQWMAQGASRPSACFASGWYDYLLHRILTFMDQTGMSALASDGPYSGYSCHSTNHAHHDGLHDSVYKQNQLQAEFFEIMVKRGVFINQPDHYFYHGGCKTGMGYNEHQYSLPRWQDLSVSRQGMFDDTFAFTPTVGWMHVPLVQYHGGGAAAAFEPLSDHLPEYEWALAQYLGAGVAAAYRGHRLYDSDKAKAIVTKWVAFYNRHRPILSSDIIHVRRADMQDIDCLLHVNPYLGTRGLAMVFNPTAHEVTTWLSLPLYYTGLETVARVAVQDGEPRDYTLNRDYSIDVPLVMPPGNITWITVA